MRKINIFLCLLLILTGCDQSAVIDVVNSQPTDGGVISTELPEATADESQPDANPTNISEVNTGDNSPPTTTPTPLPDNWQDFPVVPELSARAIEIYQQGIAMGNDPHRFSKIGDCQNITTYFLAPLEDPELFSLGEEYTYLQETLDWFAGSFSRESLAVDGGLNVARVLSPFHADVEQCLPNEHPLACEVRVYNPSMALLSLEENWESRTKEEYEQYLRKVIEYLIAEGVVPILGTKADNLEGDHSINATIVSLAVEYQLPVWNFWRAVQPLPNHGLQGDGFHLTMAGPFFDDPYHMRAAWPWRNLTALQVIDAVWHQGRQ